MKVIGYIIGCIAVTFILTIVFTLIGITIGGNYFTSFEFMGNRGYEATGMIGTFIGIILGVIVSIFGYLYFFDENEKDKTPLR